jgi:hypothetical protein
VFPVFPVCPEDFPKTLPRARGENVGGPTIALYSHRLGEHTPRPFSAGVAQLVRAGVSYALGQGFDSLLRH